VVEVFTRETKRTRRASKSSIGSVAPWWMTRIACTLPGLSVSLLQMGLRGGREGRQIVGRSCGYKRSVNPRHLIVIFGMTTASAICSGMLGAAP